MPFDSLSRTNNTNSTCRAVVSSKIFAAKIETGCSRDATASNYRPSPDVEVCCEWDGAPPSSPDARAHREVALSFHGDPGDMKARAAFFEPAGGDAAWCAAYAEQVRTDVACSLAVPQQYVAVNPECSAWQAEGIQVKVILKDNPMFAMEHACR